MMVLYNRMGLIQTPDQLKFSYLSIMEVTWTKIKSSTPFTICDHSFAREQSNWV